MESLCLPNSQIQNLIINLGCDRTGKIGTKARALEIAKTKGYSLLHSFAARELSKEMIATSELFLVSCVSKNTRLTNFDELREEIYHNKSFKLDIEKLPPTSNSIKLHIRRAYLQAYLWYRAPFEKVLDLDPTEFCYARNDDDHFYAVVTIKKNVPEDFSLPCNCNKCARDGVCLCRRLTIACCKFCKFPPANSCKLPNN